MNHAWIDAIQWTEDGLLPAIAQDVDSGKVLMFAWMNKESLQLSVAEGYATYWSRSRKRLWRKGEESGHRQKIVELRIDCDADVLLLKIKQEGGIACHTGRESCFYQKLGAQGWEVCDPVLKDPATIYTQQV